MSLETPAAASSEKSDAEKRVDDLQARIRSLELIKSSLSQEGKGVRAAASGIRTAIEAAKATSEEVVRDAIPNDVSDAQVNSIKEKALVLEGAMEQAHMYSDPSIGSPELISKLATFGIEVLPGTSSYDVDRAISLKLGEMDYALREARLAVPGEKERMIVEAIQKNQLLDPESLREAAGSYRYLTTGDERMHPTITTLYEKLPRVSWYPPEVTEGIVRQQVLSILSADNATSKFSEQSRDALAGKVAAYARMQAQQDPGAEAAGREMVALS